MTYQLDDLIPFLDQQSRKENFTDFKPGERMRCSACNSIYWRVFYDRAQCMGCRGITRFITEAGGAYKFHDLRDVSWVRWQVTKYKDGRVRDPINKRSEFVIYKNYLKSRVGGTELLIHPQLKAYWFYGKVEEKFKVMTPNQIMTYLKNGVENVREARND